MAFTITYWLFAAYLVLGSFSIGYMLLRTGWPKVRILEAPYKFGWSLVFGLGFAAVSVLGSLAVEFLAPGLVGASTALFAISAGCFLAAFPVLTARRRFFGAKTVHVEVPKEVVGAKIAAAKAVDKLSFDRNFIDTSGLQLDRLREMRTALARAHGARGTGAAAGAAVGDGAGAQAAHAGAATGAAGRAARHAAAREAERRARLAPQEKPKWMVEEMPKKEIGPGPAAAQRPGFARGRFSERLEAEAKKREEEEAIIAEADKADKKEMAVKDAERTRAAGRVARILSRKRPAGMVGAAVGAAEAAREAKAGHVAEMLKKKAAEKSGAKEKKGVQGMEEEKRKRVAEIMKKIKEIEENGEG